MIPLSMKKEALIEKLEAVRPLAEKADKIALAKHKKDEVEHLKAFKVACREALKWSYDEASKNGFSARPMEIRTDYQYKTQKQKPHCPTSAVNTLETLIAQVKQSGVERFNIKHNGKYYEIYRFLMLAEKEVPADMCKV